VSVVPFVPEHPGAAGLGVTEPATGLVFVELSQEWGAHTPVFPGFADIRVRRVTTHATHGVLAQNFVSVMHHGTHVNAPLHLVQRGAGVGELGLETFFGNGKVLSVPKGEWELIEPADLEAAATGGASPGSPGAADVGDGDIVVINTGWHHKYSDSIEYFGHGPGLSKAAARWLVDRGVKLVGIDTATIDHPLATSLAQRYRELGPLIKELPRRYAAHTGRQPSDDHPEWSPAHRTLLAAGIPTIENVGADVDAVSGRWCTFQAYPWFWPEGDACVVRLVAILDPTGDYRLESGS
jgi:kynurenine formamidase